MQPMRVVALAAAAAQICACDAFLGVEDRLQRAGGALDAGDYVTALAETKTAIEKQPEHAAARVLLAETLLQLGDAAAARVELDRAVLLGADRTAARDLNYRILAGERRHEERLELIAADTSLQSRERLLLQAETEIAAGDPARALATIRNARQVDAEDDASAFLEAQALWLTGHQQEAMSALDRLHGRNPQQARWWLFRARYELSRGRANEAREAFLKARQSGQAALDLQEQLAAIAGLVESNLAAGDLAAAEQALAQLQLRAPGGFGTLFLKGRVALARRDYAAATTELQRALVEFPGMPMARMLLGASLLQQGLLEQADVELSQLLAEQPGDADARNLLASVYVARNDIESARRVLATAPAGTAPNAGAGWMMGDLLLRTGHSTDALALLEASLAMDPDNAELRVDLVRAYLADGQPDKARQMLAMLPVDRAGNEHRQLTVLAATRGQEPGEADRRVAALAAGQTDDPAMQVAAGAYFLAIGDLDSARRTFERAVALAPEGVDGRLGLAAIAIRMGDAPLAESELRQALAAHDGDERLLLALAEVAQARHDRPAARRWLEQAVGSDPASVEPRLRLAEQSLADRDPQRARSLFDQVLAITRDAGAVHQRIGAIHVRHADYDRALVHFNEAAARGVAGAAMDAVRALLVLGREDEARSRLEQETRRDPKASMPVALLAALDAADRRTERALERVAAFERAGGEPSAAAEMRGDLHATAGRASDAAQAYAQAGARRPAEFLAIKEYFARVAAAERAPEAPLRRWLERNPRATGARYLLAERLHRVGQSAAAISEYERVLESGPHAFALNNLALLYQAAEDRRSVPTARSAWELSTGNPAIADTYGWILVQQGQSAEGLRILEGAVKAAPSQADIRFHHAAAQARVGRENEAAFNLRALLESTPQFDSRGQAETLLAALEGG